MSIRVRYFASMRVLMGCEAEEISATGIQTVGDVLKQVSRDKPAPANLLFAVNMHYARSDAPVQDGDEVAFFPPVTGGC